MALLSASQVESLAAGLAGALGASIGCYCVAPLGLVVTMKTTGGKGGSAEKGLTADKLTITGILMDRIRTEGFFGLWRGEWINALTNFQTKFGFFFCCGSPPPPPTPLPLTRAVVADAVLTQWYESRYGLMGGVANITLGYFAKLLPLPIVTPSQVLTNRMQTSSEPLGIVGAYREVIRTSGYRGLWAGAESYIVLAIWPALEMLIFDQFKRVILRSQGLPLHSELSGGVAFLLGAAGRFTATTIVFPTIRTRSLCQKGVYATVPAAFRGMWAAGGLAGLYQGLVPELVRGVSFNAVIMAIREISIVFCRALLSPLGPYS